MSTPAGGRGGGLSLSSLAFQIIFILLALQLWPSPLMQPIKLLVVLLHELSHGLVALSSGGTVHDIVITPDEGGACESSGGNGVLIACAGYLGSMFFGGMILRASRGGSAVPATFALLSFLVLGAGVTVLHDSYSRAFAFTLAASFIFLGLFAPRFLGALFLRAIGTVSCLYALFDIYSDIVAAEPGSRPLENDAETFAALTGVPAEVVGIAWLAISALFFVAVLRASLQAPPDELPAPAAAPARVGAAGGLPS
ncbi:MAG: M50 family metallopeptidase [Thermoanaerobaculia bacterium]